MSTSSKIKNQRGIIDRQAILAQLEAVLAEDLPKPKRRPKILAIFKDALKTGHDEVRRRFEGHGQGTEAVRENCFLVDQLVRLVHDYAVEHEYPTGVATAGQSMTIAAVGGYGRGELSPKSDIDLLFLLPYKRSSHAEQVVEYMLYMLWDMGLTVGHSTRSVDECIRQAKADMTIRTALLEARWLWGDQDLFEELRRRYRADIVAGSMEEFVESKLAERDSRHEKLGEARYVLEPNIKEGKGGLRDLQTLYWIGKYLYHVDDAADLVDHAVFSRDEYKTFQKAEAFLWDVRCQLHYVVGDEVERARDGAQSRGMDVDAFRLRHVEDADELDGVAAEGVGARVEAAVLDEEVLGAAARLQESRQEARQARACFPVLLLERGAEDAR